MVWSESGIAGSISGGCVEDDLFERFVAGEFENKTPCLIRYGDGSETRKKVKLPCGGIMQVLVESMPADSLGQWQNILKQISQRQGLSRTVNLVSGDWTVDLSGPVLLEKNQQQLVYYIGPARKLLIVGANQISYYLANYASTLDFEVTICDPSEKVSAQLKNAGFEFIARYPDGIIDQRFSDANSAVVAVSHDPRLDDMALLEALPSQAFYVGAMGSKRTSAARMDRLHLLDLPEKALSRLHAPIGLSIGSKTPSEIAISIAAHLVEQYAT